MNKAEMKKSLISIVVPVYNIENEIELCLNSLANQTYQRLQIVIVDDGSTDATFKKCQKFADIFSDFKLIKIKHQGLVKARKTGIINCDGDYICFVDGDDYVDEKMYEILVDEIECGKYDFVHSCIYQCHKGDCRIASDINEDSIEIHDDNKRKEVIKTFYIYPQKGTFISYGLVSKIFVAEFIKKIYMLLPDDQQYGEDLLCLLLCLINCNSFKLINNAFYYQMIRDNSLSNTSNSKYFIDNLKLCNCFLNMFGVSDYLSDEDIEYFVKRQMIHSIEVASNNNFRAPRHFWKKMSLIKGKKIIIYGFGNVGIDYLQQFHILKSVEIVAIVDSRGKETGFDWVVSQNQITDLVYDYIIIAIENEIIANDIRTELLQIGVDEKKILWESNYSN